jgi:acetolactate synthase-1/2/3 large subunit
MPANKEMIGTQGFDAAEMVKNVVKFSRTIDDKNDAMKLFEQAYFTSREGRPGPTWLDIPIDIQSAKVNKDGINTFNNTIEYNYDSQIEEVVKLLSNAERPVILGGHGIRLANAKIEFQDLN